MDIAAALSSCRRGRADQVLRGYGIAGPDLEHERPLGFFHACFLRGPHQRENTHAARGKRYQRRPPAPLRGDVQIWRNTSGPIEGWEPTAHDRHSTSPCRPPLFIDTPLENKRPDFLPSSRRMSFLCARLWPSISAPQLPPRRRASECGAHKQVATVLGLPEPPCRRAGSCSPDRRMPTESGDVGFRVRANRKRNGNG